MICKSRKIISARKRIRRLFIVPSDADKNIPRTDLEIAFGRVGDLPTCIEALSRFQAGHPPRRAQEARHRVFIPPESHDTGGRYKNAAAARWQAGVDKFHGAAMVICFVVCFVLADAWEKPLALCRGLPQILANIDSGTLTR